MTKKRKSGLWNRNFLLLWQGQLVSNLGNAAFDIALGFWVLEKTDSTGMMGLIMACFAFPAVILGPLSGAYADRVNRKFIIVVTDLLRGILILSLGIMVFTDVFNFWLIFPIAILSGICAAFFTPAIGAAIPDLVTADNLTRANSANSLSQALSQMLGTSFGGVLYAALSAPILFVIDGISFIISAFSEAFIKLPPAIQKAEKKHILLDMVDGLKYVWQNKGMRLMLFTAMIVNFFAIMGITLFVPLFSQTESLGVTKYGFAMGIMLLGSIVSMIILSAVKLKAQNRFFVFVSSGIAMLIFMILTGFTYSFIPMLIFLFLTGASNIVINIIFQTIIQVTTPAENLGKVFGIITTVTGALSPIAMAVSGFAAQIFGVRNTIIGSFILAAVCIIPILLNKSFKEFINFDKQEAEAESVSEKILA